MPLYSMTNFPLSPDSIDMILYFTGATLTLIIVPIILVILIKLVTGGK